MSRRRGRFRILLAHFLLAVLTLGIARGASAQTLSVTNDHFHVGNNDRFLLFLSYFDGMNVAPANVATNFEYIRTVLGVDGVRILPNWWNVSASCTTSTPCYSTETLMTPSGLRTGKLTQLLGILDAAGAAGLVVDLSFSRETVCASSGVFPCPSNQVLGWTAYKNQITTVLQALNSPQYDHVLVDLQNEFDNTDPDDTNGVEQQEVQPADLATFVAALKANSAIGNRIITASTTETTGLDETLGQGTASVVINSGLDVAAYHDPRQIGWEAQTDEVVTTLRGQLASIGGQLRPVYLQEPQRWDAQPSADYVGAVQRAKGAGAAAWTFHSGTGHVLSGGTLFQNRLSGAEAATIIAVASAAGAKEWGACAPQNLPAALSAGASGQTLSVRVTMPAGCAWTASTPSGSFATIVQGASGSGTRDVDILVPANAGPGSRQTTVSFAGHDVVLTQDAPPACAPSVLTDSITAAPAGGTYPVTVNAASGCGWSTAESLSWLSIAPASGSGTQTVNVIVANNPNPGQRNGTITIAGKTITVTQDPCAVTFSPTTVTLAPSASTSTLVSVTVPNGCTWTASIKPGASWLTIAAGSSGTDSGSVTLGATANYGRQSRTGTLVVNGSELAISQSGRAAAVDFDGDSQADITIHRPGNGYWHILGSIGNYTGALNYPWGSPGDVPMADDFDGDGRTDIGVYRPSDGNWHILYSTTNYTGAVHYAWGSTGDIPLAGDFDGDGRSDVGVYRPSDGNWHILYSTTNYTGAVHYVWGSTGDVPKPGDYDGDGKLDIAIYRPSNGYWHVLTSTSNYTDARHFQWGLTGDVPRPADYDGDGATDVAAYRPSDGYWHILTSSSNFTGAQRHQWGLPGDIAVPADFDKDGRADIAIYRPSDGYWHVLTSTSGYQSALHIPWGSSTDLPQFAQY